MLPFALRAQSAGSLYAVNGRLADPTRDVRAGQVDDLVTIVVSEALSAVSSGGTNTARKSSANLNIAALAGKLAAASKLANPLTIASDQSLQGTGQTSRTTSLTTTISARVIEVTPTGNLIVEANKDITVNSEHQTITVRGMVRPADLSAANIVSSHQVANLEIKVNGKGVVGDAVRRPNALYRFILGLLPF
jgi:flagellar L-ring protein precursor FlgH